MNRIMSPLDYLWALAHGTAHDPLGDAARPQPEPPQVLVDAQYDAPPPPLPPPPSGFQPLG